MSLTKNEMDEVRSEILHEIADIERMSHYGGSYSWIVDIWGHPTYAHNPIVGHTLCAVVHPYPTEI